MGIKYHVRLADDERAMLEAMIKQEKPKVAQHKKRRAGIILAIATSVSWMVKGRLTLSPLPVQHRRKVVAAGR